MRIKYTSNWQEKKPFVYEHINVIEFLGPFQVQITCEESGNSCTGEFIVMMKAVHWWVKKQKRSSLLSYITSKYVQ